MAYQCEICSKAPRAGNSISHSHRATKRRFLPNLQKIKVNLAGTIRRLRVCTACLRSGKIQKAI